MRMPMKCQQVLGHSTQEAMGDFRTCTENPPLVVVAVCSMQNLVAGLGVARLEHSLFSPLLLLQSSLRFVARAWNVLPWTGFVFARSMSLIYRLEMCKGRNKTFQGCWGEINHSSEQGESLTPIITCLFKLHVYLEVSDSSQLSLICSSKNVLCKQCCALCNPRGTAIQYQHEQGGCLFYSMCVVSNPTTCLFLEEITHRTADV